MYLKSLKLGGFKSFADRSRLEFRPGVTVVVGPNGSGKSNIVDALSWILGTQSTKTLRTTKMEDVIFAGTATRPALSRAEATLIVDNSDRMIDLDLDEVAITRRLYRDGSSDYELNGVGCRLLDITDLLSDSGVGRHQHVIIGQGEIGRVLNASPEEHRAVIEEAAGILKHRRRKERSERRLERTDEDMVRLQDLLGEIDRQMRPLRRQAKAAERYDGLKSEVIALRLYLGGRDLHELNRELTIAESEKSRLSEGVETDQKAIGALVSDLARLTDDAKSVGSDLERDTSAAALLETTIERLRRVASVAVERGRAISGRREAAIERSADLNEQLESIARDLVEIETELRQKESAATRSETAFRRLEDEENAIATQNSLSPEGALAAVRGELSALESSISRDQREAGRVRHRLDVLEAQNAEGRDEIERINGEIREMDVSMSELSAEYFAASARRESLQEVWSSAEANLETARLARASSEARLQAIQEALDGRFDPEARETAESSAGALGSLTSQLDIPSGLEAAVSAALAPWSEAVAFEDPGSVQGAVEKIKARGGGSVSVVSSMAHSSAPACDVAADLGVDALVNRLGPNAHKGLARRLLGDVVLVEGWGIGWSIVAKHANLRAVTPEGDIISVSGVRIADPEGAGSAMLEAAEVALEAADTALARAESIHTAAKRDFERSRDDERRSLEQVERSESAMAGASEAMVRLEASARGLGEERDRLYDRLAALSDSIDSGEQQSAVLRARLESLEGEEAQRLAVWEEMEERRVTIAAKREAARSDWQDAATAHRAVLERHRLLEDRRRVIESELGRARPGTPSEADPVRLEQVASFARQAVGVLDGRIEELRDRQASLRTQNDAVRSELDATREEHQTRTEKVAKATARISELDVTLTELRMRREAVIESISRDADADVEDALGAPRPDLPEDADLEEMLESGLIKLRRLGPINPLAAREYAELAERHEFLSTQMEDVMSSRAELRKVITALEEEIENRFDKAFTEVAAAYERYFDVLFPGGRGRIRLMDPDDAQSGVLIDAQPLGKKVSQMTLLSGGERSLAALAFLFAIFEARPSPFYVLDEVEAALDDANLRRFLRIVDAFRQRAQLIIVTHQQQTMEAADVLYGVTMEPGGSSKVIRKEMRAQVVVDQTA
ncbi:MAG: chromosome segregation protein SMC [Acidimicrobiia bacterium]